MDEMIVIALLCIDNIQESLATRITSKYENVFIGKLLEDSNITGLSEGADIVLKYFDEDREYYILGLLDDFIKEEQYKKETIDYLVLSEIMENVNKNFKNKEEFTMLKKYIQNNKINEVEDVERQAIVISGKQLKYEYEPVETPFEFTEEEMKYIDKLKLPFNIHDLEYWDDDDYRCIEKNQIAYKSIDDAIKNSKTRSERTIYENIMEKIFESVPEDEVREIHIFDIDNMEMDIKFLDEAGVHAIVSRKAKLYFADGRTKVGYVGSDFKLNDEECICIFESYDKEKGFGDYNYYLLKDLKKVEVIETNTPRYKEKIDFEFKLPKIEYK